MPEYVRTIGLEPKSINTRIKNLKTMFKFLHEEGVIDSNPFAYLKTSKTSGAILRFWPQRN